MDYFLYDKHLRHEKVNRLPLTTGRQIFKKRFVLVKEIDVIYILPGSSIWREVILALKTQLQSRTPTTPNFCSRVALMIKFDQYIHSPQ